MLNKNCRKIALLALFSLGLGTSTVSLALPFNITKMADTSLPTQVIPGQITTAFYTVTNNTGSVRSGNYVKYLPPNVGQVPSDPIYSNLCGSNFTLNPHGTSGSSCTLELAISNIVNANDPDPHHHLFVCFPKGVTCAGTLDSLNVTAVTPASFTRAYVPNYGNNRVSLCSINSITGKLTQCEDSGAGAVFNTPGSIALNSMGTHAYVTNFGNGGGTTVSLCTVDPSSGKLSNCGITGSGFMGPLGVTLDASGKHAYVGNLAGNFLSLCSVNPNGTLSGCMPTGNDFVQPVTVTFSTGGTRAYVSNQSGNTVSLCSVSLANGVLSGCANSAADPTAVFAGPAYMTFNLPETRIYVGENNGGVGTRVALCSVNLVTGKLSACNDSGAGPAFLSPNTILFNALHTLVYVSNQGGTTVSLCSVNPSSGILSGCTNAAGDGTAVFAQPSGMALR